MEFLLSLVPKQTASTCCSSDVISRGNQWWRREMSAVFSGQWDWWVYLFTPRKLVLWETSDTPVKCRGAQKLLNRTGNLGSVSEDWKRLQGLGWTNKILESRSLSDFNISMYTTPIGDTRLRTFTIKQRTWTVPPHDGSLPRITSIHSMSFCRSLSPKKENTPGKTATARVDQHPCPVIENVTQNIRQRSTPRSLRFILLEYDYRDREGYIHFIRTPIQYATHHRGESCIAQVFILRATRRSLKALETVAAQLCSVIAMALKSPFLHTSNNQRLRSARYNDRRSKRFCSNAVLCVSFSWQMVKTRVIRFLRVIEGRNARDQIELCAFHSLLVEVQANAGYTHSTQRVITTSGLGWRAPLVARNNYV